ncbi:DUF3180 domain-containing protein [Actinokineospora cianjurensis]|uniref:Uncharacterized protein DUF3180 n=1 Tax=Actinokineospora cianjurensis TaxID=585224 RepID=A0A421B6G8_9PSEU|nr:DUF3180 domain-containing protein [Actinokineospora cianjurensis]RLK59833.1 uncharacterized protein DUF3180 [Actinokineospora cianjurensis]
MTFTKPRDLVLAGLVGAVVVYLALRVLYGDLPPLPRLAGITLLVLAVVEALFGFGLRDRIKGTGKAVQPLTAARAVALAKASSVLGAIMVGAWLGVLGYVLPESAEVAAAKHDVASAVVGVVCAAALIAAALWLESCCRTPDDRDDQRRDPIR